MNTVRQVALKLRAWDIGRPVARYDIFHHAIAPPEDVLIVAFVRMAGESRPWGIAWGTAGSQPSVRSVPDGRVRDDVSELVAALAEDLLAHLRVHNWTYDPAPDPKYADAHELTLRQVWVPNDQHVAMLHQLSYMYSQTKFGGTNQDILRALGRAAGWLFRDSSRAGNQHLVSATKLLNETYAYPAQDARTAHLGFQLAWLATDGDLDSRLQAASHAEELTVSPTMDPTLERDRLDNLVTKSNAARRSGDDTTAVESGIDSILSEELKRRWQLAEEAYLALQADDLPTNSGVAHLVCKAHTEFWYQHQRIELRVNDPSEGPAFVAHPETDFHGSAAASRYLAYAASDEAHVSHLIHDDDSLFRDATTDGHAFTGRVVDVWDTGTGRSTAPHWKIRVDPSAPHRIREGGRLTPRRSPGHEATVVALESTGSDLVVTVVWSARKTKPLTDPIEAKPVDKQLGGSRRRFRPVGRLLSHRAAQPPSLVGGSRTRRMAHARTSVRSHRDHRRRP